MAKLPEFERGETITPQASPANVASSFAGQSQKFKDLANFSLDYATKMASQRAVLEGTASAQKDPYKQFAPAFTETDRVFQDAYRQEAFKTIASDANSYMDKVNFEFSKILNPTASDIEQYDNATTKGLEAIIGAADSQIRPELARAAQAAQDAGKYQLAKRVEKSNNERMFAAGARASNENIDNITNYHRLNMPEYAAQSAEAEKQNISSMYSMGLIDTEERDKAFENLRRVEITAPYVAQTLDLDERAGAKYISDFVKNRPEGMSPTDHLMVAEQMYKAYNNKNNLLDAEQSIQYSDAKLSLDSNPDQPDSWWQQKKRDLSPQQYNDLVSTWRKAQAKQDNINATVQYMDANKDNALGLANLDNKELDAAWDFKIKQAQQIAQQREEAFGLEHMAEMAAGYDVAIPSFNKMLSRGVNSSNPEVAAQSALVYSRINKTKPSAVAAMNAESQLKAQTIANQITAQVDPATAVAHANDQFANMSKMEVDSARSMFKRDLKGTNGLDKAANQQADLIERLGWKPSNEDDVLIIPGMLETYMSMAEDNYVISGMLEESLQDAAEQVAHVYKRTEINGFEQTMFMPPTMFVGDKFARDDMIYQLDNLSSKQEDAMSDPDSAALFAYKVDEERSGEPIDISVRGGKAFRAQAPIYATQTDREGNVKKGMLLIKSDKFTATPPPDSGPTWGIEFLEDGKIIPVPVYNPETYGNARYELKPRAIEEYNTRAKVEDAAVAKALDEHQKNQTQLRNKILELREALGEDLYYE